MTITPPIPGSTRGRQWSRYCWGGGGWVQPASLRQGMIVVDIADHSVMAAWLATEGGDVLHPLSWAENGADVILSMPSGGTMRLPTPIVATT